MKQSVPLNVITVSNLSETQLAINPNDGFDLGLMTTNYEVNVFHNNTDVESGETIEKSVLFNGKVLLKNECANNTVELPQSLVIKLNNPQRVLLTYEDGDLGIISNP